MNSPGFANCLFLNLVLRDPFVGVAQFRDSGRDFRVTHPPAFNVFVRLSR